MPHQRNPFFTGRTDILTQLYNALATGKPAALTQAITGLGGIGKTQTAVEYAYRHRDEYEAVFWLSAASEESLLTGFSKIAHLLDLPEASDPDQSMVTAAVQQWLRDHTGWLLILDNADDIPLARKALPSGAFGHVLITSREKAFGGLADVIRIEKLEPDEGSIFLLRRAGILAADAPFASASAEDRAAALTLTSELGGLPLALDQAGAYIEETPSTPAKYLSLYRTRRGALLKQRGTLGEADHASVTTTYSLALERVESVSPASADLMRLFAFLAPDAIPEEILTLGADHLGDILALAMRDGFARGEAIKYAYRWSLLEYDPKAGLFSVHRLVQAVIQEEMDAETRRAWAERTVLAVNSAFPEVEFSVWPLCERLTPHALVCVEHIETYNIETAEAARLLNQTAYYLQVRARYTAAEPLFQRAQTIYEKVLGPEHPGTAVSLNNLAELYRAQANYIAAEPLYQQALAIVEKALGPEHPRTAASLNGLALLYKIQRNYVAAEPLYQRALAINERALGREDPDTSESLNNLAVLYRSQGNYAAAEPLHQRALAIREKVLGPEHPDTAQSLNNLAALYYNQGNYMEAEPLYERSLVIQENAFGPEHPSTAGSYWWLATLRQKQGDFAIAEPYYLKALAVYEKSLGLEHPNSTQCLKNYATLLRSMGRESEAAEMEARAAEGKRKHEERNKRA